MTFTGRTPIYGNFLTRVCIEKVPGNGCPTREGDQGVCARPGCGIQFEQAATGRRRRFCSARCKQAFYRAGFRNATPQPASASFPAMPVDIRHHGGHLERDQSSVIDGSRHDERIDAELRRILGGIPKPRAPRAPVIELPLERLDQAVAA